MRRTVEQLLAAAKLGSEKEKREQARAVERKRLAELKALAQREDEAWREAHALIQKQNAKGYEAAVQLISRLREVARSRQTETVFQARLNDIYERNRTRHSLLARLHAAGLQPALDSSG